MPTPSASEALSVDPALLARFRADVAALLDTAPTPGEPLCLAVSGGGDSFAMLALAAAAFPGSVSAATVDHGLRPANAEEAAAVHGWCADHHIPHVTLAVAVPAGATGNLHAWARQERYTLLRRWAVEHQAVGLCTAHHADDQAETFLMRAARGSGLSGLAAVRARIDDELLVPNGPGWTPIADGGARFACAAHPLILLRPLLNWRRSELRGLAKSSALPFADDPSNDDSRFERTRLRGWLIEAPWLDVAKVSRAAQRLAETDRDLFALSRWLWEERVRRDDPYQETVDVADLPRELRRRLARIAIDGVRTSNGIQAPDWDFATNIEPLLDALDAGTAATQAGVLACARGRVWNFRAAPPRRTG